MCSLRCFIVACGVTLLLAGCATSEIAYIHDAPRNTVDELNGQFSKGIQPNDLLYIYVESSTPESAIQFNKETNQLTTVGDRRNGQASEARMGYLVNHEGDIVFPILGRLHVGGMTHRQLAEMLEQRLITEGYITDPVVTVRLMNFKVSILGDVARPMQLNVDGERMTIFEALSMVGDLTIYGQRTNVTVIREENGVRTVGTVDLTSKDVFDSPYYYLHQNDVVYVEPNERHKRDASRNPNTFSYISIGISVLSMLISLYYYNLIYNK